MRRKNDVCVVERRLETLGESVMDVIAKLDGLNFNF